MSRILVAGIGTDVGKSVVSAILTTQLQASYWKPIQCGNEDAMRDLIDANIYPPAYIFNTAASPHQAARLENREIDVTKICPPDGRLIIEGIGGILVPLSLSVLTIDLYQSWNCKWVIVSKHYLGSINQTLLTLEVLKNRAIPIAGIIFNGIPNPDSEAAILKFGQLPVLGRLLPEPRVDKEMIQRYAQQWPSLL